jgi:hypothetical protein
MAVRNVVRIVALAGVTAAASVALLAGGCGPRPRSALEYLPGEKYVVGGGLNIDWKAPEPGTVYLVEKQTGKIMETRTLEKGETYTFSVASVTQADELEQLLGITIAKAQIVLYFVPAAEERPAP